MQFWQLLGDLHPKLVQFPLVLLLAGLIFDAAGLSLRNERLNFAAKILSASGTFFLLFAFICGIYAEIWAGRAGIPQEQIEWHELLANVASWGFVVLMAWRLFLDSNRRGALTIYTVIGLGWYVLLVMTGYFGGKLVFDYGAAVAGATANDVLSLHDLNVLATRQTDANLRYSELMHHVAGWATLALSGSLFLYALFPKKADKLRWVGPGLLMVGGAFLFFFADLDLYRLFDPRQLRDREVQLHKTLALVLIVVGFAGLRRAAKLKPRHTSDAEFVPASPGLSTPSKVVAVMALIGGGMLFTHVHTVAPYANVAAGVYIAHITMGLTALGIGAARLLQDGLPRWRKPMAVLFAVLMCLESCLLITYNEGLPWYIGYGRYTRTGPHGGTIAPYGPIRAELAFDQAASRLDLYVLDRFDNSKSVPVSTDQVNVLISHGYTETAVPLAAESPSHFSAIVPFMRTTAAFCARAALPLDGSMKMGYFDPWVDPRIAGIPPNETARYQCPMHDGILSETPGVCPLCGMKLLPILTTPRTTLHEADYGMKLEIALAGAQLPQSAGAPLPSSPGIPGEDRGGGSAERTSHATPTLPSPGVPGEGNVVRARQQVSLRFVPMYQAKILHNLILVHEHYMHLIVVSSDLKFFDHVHPVMCDDGTLTLNYTFAQPGRYLLFADVTPDGQRNQVFRLPIDVASEDGQTQLMSDLPNLIPAPASAKPIGDGSMTAELIFQPRTPVSGLHTNFIFRLMREGRPVNDLQPYIGAMGHCVIISADTQTYLHCHPEQLETPTTDARGGPDVPFHTIFPHPGLYKIWGQFKRGDQVVVADFVVDVKSPLLPPSVANFLLND